MEYLAKRRHKGHTTGSYATNDMYDDVDALNRANELQINIKKFRDKQRLRRVDPLRPLG